MSSFFTFMFTYRFIRAVAYTWATRWLCGHRLGKQPTFISLCLSQYEEKIQHTTSQGICQCLGWRGALKACKCTSWVHEEKFVLKECSQFSFIRMGYVIFNTLWKIAIETMRQLIWRKNSESLYLPLFYLWPWYGLLLLQVHLEVDCLLFRWLCQLVMKFVLVLLDNNSYIVCECIITVTVWLCYFVCPLTNSV